MAGAPSASPRAFIVEVSEGWVVVGEGAPELEE